MTFKPKSIKKEKFYATCLKKLKIQMIVVQGFVNAHRQTSKTILCSQRKSDYNEVNETE